MYERYLDLLRVHVDLAQDIVLVEQDGHQDQLELEDVNLGCEMCDRQVVDQLGILSFLARDKCRVEGSRQDKNVGCHV